MMKSKRSIAILITILFLFQFFTPLVQTHTPKACEELKKEWQDKLKDQINKNEALQELLKSSAAGATAKGAAVGAAVGAGAAAAGGAAVGLVFGPPGAGILAAKGAVGGGVGGFITGGVAAFLARRKAIKDARKEYEAAKKAAEEAKKAYDRCMKHVHPTGSLVPYGSDTYVRSGEAHSSYFSSNMPFYAVYWYVRAPGESGYGTLMSTDMGDGSKTSSMFSFTPNAIGTHTITAHTYFTSDIIDSTYYISVSH